jgi:hypothetical protein
MLEMLLVPSVLQPLLKILRSIESAKVDRTLPSSCQTLQIDFEFIRTARMYQTFASHFLPKSQFSGKEQLTNRLDCRKANVLPPEF